MMKMGMKMMGKMGMMNAKRRSKRRLKKRNQQQDAIGMLEGRWHLIKNISGQCECTQLPNGNVLVSFPTLAACEAHMAQGC